MNMTDDLGGNILLLSGHPGSGKSTIAEALAKLPGVPNVHFHSDDLWGYIKHGRIDPASARRHGSWMSGIRPSPFPVVCSGGSFGVFFSGF
jgi:chloramphenicol 3-O-phosphotransferase